jgi:hypothetical protein
MKYKYEMVQLAPHILINPSSDIGSAAATYLKEIVNERAELGWEFFRIDTIKVTSKPGCISALIHTLTAGIFGKKEESLEHYVATFRQEV